MLKHQRRKLSCLYKQFNFNNNLYFFFFLFLITYLKYPTVSHNPPAGTLSLETESSTWTVPHHQFDSTQHTLVQLTVVPWPQMFVAMLHHSSVLSVIALQSNSVVVVVVLLLLLVVMLQVFVDWIRVVCPPILLFLRVCLVRFDRGHVVLLDVPPLFL